MLRRGRSLAVAGLAALAGWLGSLQGCGAQDVRYPAPEAKDDSRGEYPVQVLQLALKKSGRPWVASASPLPMGKGRAVLELLRADGGLDVIWAQTSSEREQLMRPIRLPIDRGLIGWRIALLRADDAHRFAGVRDLEGLKASTAGQGHDWPDLKILQANGLRVNGVTTYGALFTMLARRRFDYLPRSIGEIWGELRHLEPLQIAADRHLLLHYPAALYFFVRRDNEPLAQALTQGLEQAQRDGSLEALFEAYYGESIRAAEVQQRRVIELVNPLLPPGTPLHRSEWWWRPAAGNPLPRAAPAATAPQRPAAPDPQRSGAAVRTPSAAASGAAPAAGARSSSG